MRYLLHDVTNDRGVGVPQGTIVYPRPHARNTEAKQFVMYRTGAEEGNPKQHTMFVPSRAIGTVTEKPEFPSYWDAQGNEHGEF